MTTLNENILCKKKELTKQGDIAYFIYDLFKKSNKDKMIVINIGTDKTKFDSFAPFVGTILKERNSKLKIYGDLERPIHAVNLKDKMRYINKKNQNAFILAIDAAVTEKDENKIIARNKPIKPRLGKDLGSVGDASIIFTVDKRNTCWFNLDNNMRIGDVYKGVNKTVNELLLLEKLLIKNQNNNIIKFA